MIYPMGKLTPKQNISQGQCRMGDRFGPKCAHTTLMTQVCPCHTHDTAYSGAGYNVKQEKIMNRYVIEREIPSVGSLNGEQLQGAAAKSCDALSKLGTQVQWIESFVAADKTFCIYLAENEGAIHKHAELSGFPANRITKVQTMIDPTTAG
jgi:Protein of unknown function (DUF4242)